MLYAKVLWPESNRRAGLKMQRSAFSEGGGPFTQYRIYKMLGLKKTDVCEGDDIEKYSEAIYARTTFELLDLSAVAKEAFNVLHDKMYSHHSLHIWVSTIWQRSLR